MYNIANVVWQLVHYTVYGTPKSDNGLGFASSIIVILRPVNCIVDSPPSNICIIVIGLDVLSLSGGFTPCQHLRPSSGREHSHNLLSPVMTIT